MSVERSQTQPAALPPTDHVARVLLKRGAREDALTFLRAAIARDPEERACAALLKAIEARPDASVYGPDLVLDTALVDSYARSGMLVEALAVLRGAGLDGVPEGSRRAQMLEELLGPCPADADDELARADAEIRTGGAAVALTLLEERIERDAFVPEWARKRHALLTQLLLEAPEQAPSAVGARGAGRERSPLGSLIGERFEHRDPEGALREARSYAEAHPGDVEAEAVVDALAGLVAAMTSATAETSAPIFGTQPMHGHSVALFQLRMGNVAEAERLFRKMVLEEPFDELARRRLDEVQVIREAVEGPQPLTATGRRRGVDPLKETARDQSGQHVAPAPVVSDATLATGQTLPLDAEPTRRESFGAPAELPSPEPLASEPTVRSERPPVEPPTVEVSLDAVTREVGLGPPSGERPGMPEPRARRRIPSSPDMLSKVSRKLTPDEGWAQAADDAEDWEEEETEVGSLEDQAELMLAQGYAERALETYDRLVAAQPDRPALARRRDEIRELVARGDEPPTSVEVRAPASGEMDLEEDPTLVTSSPFEAQQEPEPPDAADRAPADGAEVQVHRIITIA